MNLPQQFISYTRALMGEDRYQALEEGLQTEPPVSIRLNPLKCRPDQVKIPSASGRVPWCQLGYYLSARPNFTFDPLLHAGVYYVQEASSMFLAHVLRQLVDAPVQMLDLCAAPGGKSTLARSFLPEGSVLFSNEPDGKRAQILNENMLKFGHPDVVVTSNVARDYQQAKLQFDLILTDVPCSGEGMFRKDAGAIEAWSPQNVEKCWRLQRSIVTDIWPCLKPGGYLVYSTCTLNAHEDEENVNWIAREQGADFVEIPVEKAWHITGSLVDDHPVYRFIPGITVGEGLFVAVLRKHGDPHPVKKRPLDTRRLHVLSHGVAPDLVKGKSHIPDISKALSTTKASATYPRVAVSYEQAISYLRKQAVNLPAETPRGIVLLTYKGVPIGYEKNLGQRANNLYPQAWRVKSTHLPDQQQNIIEL